MTHLCNRLLCLAVAAIMSLGVVTATEARDKQKCCTTYCQPAAACCKPAPLCYQGQPGGLRIRPLVAEWHCATDFLFECTTPSVDGEPVVVSYAYASGACDHQCEAGPTIILGAAPPAPGCVSPCSTPGNHCVQLDVEARLAKDKQAKNGQGHKGLPSRAFNRLNSSAGFKARNPTTSGIMASPVSERLVKFDVRVQNETQPQRLVFVLKVFEAKKKNVTTGNWEHRGDARLGVELDAGQSNNPNSNGNQATLIVNPSLKYSNQNTVVLDLDGVGYVVMTQTILDPPQP